MGVTFKGTIKALYMISLNTESSFLVITFGYFGNIRMAAR